MPDPIPTALVFPGRGALAPDMLDGLRTVQDFAGRYETVCEILRADLERQLSGDPAIVAGNHRLCSLLAVLTNSLYLDLLAPVLASSRMVGVAGYSVGQWSALHAAGVVTFEQMARIVHTRGALLENCGRQHPGGMSAVIGVKPENLEAVCADLRSRGRFAAVANYNSPGHCTVAYAGRWTEAVLKELRGLQPAKLIELEVGGGWHSELMKPASRAFLEYLLEEPLSPSELPVIDNVTGDFLPAQEHALKTRLAEQLSRPIQWMAGIRTLVGRGTGRFVESGFGRILTQFGFFIDRSVEHRRAEEMMRQPV